MHTPFACHVRRAGLIIRCVVPGCPSGLNADPRRFAIRAGRRSAPAGDEEVAIEIRVREATDNHTVADFGLLPPIAIILSVLKFRPHPVRYLGYAGQPHVAGRMSETTGLTGFGIHLLFQVEVDRKGRRVILGITPPRRRITGPPNSPECRPRLSNPMPKRHIDRLRAQSRLQQARVPPRIHARKSHIPSHLRRIIPLGICPKSTHARASSAICAA